MSQIPAVPQPEPLVGEVPAPAQPTGTGQGQVAVSVSPNQVVVPQAPQAPAAPLAPQVDVAALQAELEATKAEADRLKGFQAVYTRAKQSGVWDGVENLLDGTNPEGAKAKWEALNQGQSVLSEIEAMGGWERVKADYQLLNDVSPAAQTPTTPQQPPVQDNVVGQGDINAVIQSQVEKKVAEMFAAIDRTGTKQEAAEAIAKEYGLATDGNPANPAVLTMIQGAIDRDLEQVTSGLREPELGEIQAAGQRVAQTLFAPLRASGAPTVPPTIPEPQALPPGMNARVPSGQQPAKPVSEYTREEQRAAARQLAGDIIQPTLDAMPTTPELPDDGQHEWR
jgi:hypothetical protein